MPDLHVKPTKEELEAGIKKAEEDLAKLEENPEPTPSEEIEEPEEHAGEPTPSEEIPSPSEEVPVEPSEEIPPVEPKNELPPAEERLKESSREAKVLYAKNQKLAKAIEEAGTLPAPTDEEMKIEYPDWDTMDSVQKQLAKDNVWNKRKFNAIDAVAKESKDIDAWNTKVDEFVSDPKVLVDNPELEGKVEEFKIFAMKATRRGVDLPDLVLAFSGEVAKSAKPRSKGQMFETGSGGPNDAPKPKSNILTVEQGRVLMKTNYKLYREKLQAGLIANE